MVGQDIEGSDYSLLSGKTNAPNTVGRFLRDAGGNAPLVGENQGDAIRNIVGEIAAGGEYNHAMTGAFAASTATSSAAWEGTTYPRRANFDASRVVPTAVENRPRNTSVNYFLKINKICN